MNKLKRILKFILKFFLIVSYHFISSGGQSVYPFCLPFSDGLCHLQVVFGSSGSPPLTINPHTSEKETLPFLTFGFATVLLLKRSGNSKLSKPRNQSLIPFLIYEVVHIFEPIRSRLQK